MVPNELMEDAQDVFDTEWDPFSEPKLHFENSETATLVGKGCVT